MPGQHNNAVKSQRSRRAIAVAEQMSREFRQALVGQEVEVLFEEEHQGVFSGYTANYIKVYAPGQGLHNQLCRVRITGVYGDGVEGEL